MRGLNNDLPFYICEFRAAEAFEMQRMQCQLINTLGSFAVECLGGRGVKVLEINLYDLCIDLLKAREGSSQDSTLWDEIIAIESDVEKDNLLELLQNVLGIEDYLVPAIAERMQQAEFDVLFLSGIGEVFPYIRSHNVLNNLQSTAKEKFFGKYFEQLTGTLSLRQQIIAGKSEAEIRQSWKPALGQYKLMRQKYLLYPDFK